MLILQSLKRGLNNLYDKDIYYFYVYDFRTDQQKKGGGVVITLMLH